MECFTYTCGLFHLEWGNHDRSIQSRWWWCLSLLQMFIRCFNCDVMDASSWCIRVEQMYTLKLLRLSLLTTQKDFLYLLPCWWNSTCKCRAQAENICLSGFSCGMHKLGFFLHGLKLDLNFYLSVNFLAWKSIFNLEHTWSDCGLLGASLFPGLVLWVRARRGRVPQLADVSIKFLKTWHIAPISSCTVGLMHFPYVTAHFPGTFRTTACQTN